MNFQFLIFIFSVLMISLIAHSSPQKPLPLCKISQKNLKDISILSEFIQKPDVKKKSSISKIFLSLMKDISSELNFNKNLHHCQSHNRIFFQSLHSGFLDSLFEFSFKHSKDYSHLNKKIENLIHFVGKNGSPLQTEKLSIPELRTLESLISFHRTFENFQIWFSAKKDYDSSTLKILNSLSKAKYLHQRILEPLQRQPQQKQFLWIAYDFKKDFSYRRYHRHLIQIIHPFAKIFGFQIEHISLSFPRQNHIYETHMWGHPSVFKISKKPIISYLYSSFRLNYKKMFSPHNYLKNLEKIHSLYGERWEEHIDSSMIEIINDYFAEPTDFSKLYNSRLRRLKMILNHHIHYRKTKLSKQFRFSQSGKTTCSEFTMKVILQSLQLLNKKIQIDWEKSGYSGNHPSLSINLTSYSKIKNLSPQSITKKMIKQGIITEIPISKIAEKFIRL
ncbi:MAG: hypothetical protein AB8C84_08765 [Oligoflexales bacterium]